VLTQYPLRLPGTVMSRGLRGDGQRTASTRCPAGSPGTARARPAGASCFLPSGLSPSVLGFHQLNRPRRPDGLA